MNPWLSKNGRLMLAGGLVLALILIRVSFGGDDDPEPSQAGSTTSTRPVTAAPPSSADQPNSEVPPLDCWDLITIAEVQEALGVADDPDRSGLTGESKHERCHHTLESDEEYFVEIDPGGPGDFGSGTVLLGVAGKPLTGVGDESRWFGGPESDGADRFGALVVKQASQYGTIYFRVLVGRPDVDDATRQRIAVGLANAAIPRFPGVEIPEPELVAWELPAREPPDTRSWSLADNLLAREEAGEWTRGEGLVAILSLLVGDLDPGEVLGDTDIADPSATSLIDLAFDYLETGDDPEDRAEVEALLDRLILTEEELAELTAPATGQGTSGLVGSSGGLFLTTGRRLLAQESDPCGDIDTTPPCLVEWGLPVGLGSPGQYRLYSLILDQDVWQHAEVQTVIEALGASVAAFEPLRDMPLVEITLHPDGRYYRASYINGRCYMDLGPSNLGVDGLKQVVARELAVCLVTHNFAEQLADRRGSKWWRDALVLYLSGYVYPAANMEHHWFGAAFNDEEYPVHLPARGATNWTFFEYLHPTWGPKGSIDMVAGFPFGGDPIEVLADQPGIEDMFHEFELALTDANLDDLGPGKIPFAPESTFVPLDSPGSLELVAWPFDVFRLQLNVPAGSYACIDTIQTALVQSSWRPGVPGEEGPWSKEQPEVLSGDTTLVFTSTWPEQKFQLRVHEIRTDPDCEDRGEPWPSTLLDDCGLCDPSRFFWGG